MIAGLGYLAAASAGLLAAAGGVQYLWGGGHLAAAGGAVGLAGGVGSLVLAADAWWTRVAGPVGAYAAGVAARTGGVFGGGLVLVFGLGAYPAPAFEFWGWLLAAYVVTLAIETLLLARVRPA